MRRPRRIAIPLRRAGAAAPAAALLPLRAAAACLAWLLAILVLSGSCAVPVAAEEAASPDPERLLRAAVRVEARVPPEATTAASLGQSRDGNGIVIGEDGLILTIGYLILEAMTVDVTDHSGRRLPAEILAYDFNTGFGLLRALVPLQAEALPLGRSADLAAGDPVLVVGHPEQGGLAPARISAIQPFAGGWEYLLEAAIHTVPPFSHFGGAGLVDRQGRLVGIGALAVGEAGPRGAIRTGGGIRAGPGNVFVPIDLLAPILADPRQARRGLGPRRPWLGMTCIEFGPGLLVQRVAPGGPAARAGIAAGQVVLALQGEPFAGLADFYRRLWALGEAGVAVPLQVLDGRELRDVAVTSGDRYDHLKLDPGL